MIDAKGLEEFATTAAAVARELADARRAAPFQEETRLRMETLAASNARLRGRVEDLESRNHDLEEVTRQQARTLDQLRSTINRQANPQQVDNADRRYTVQVLSARSLDRQPPIAAAADRILAHVYDDFGVRADPQYHAGWRMGMEAAAGLLRTGRIEFVLQDDGPAPEVVATPAESTEPERCANCRMSWRRCTMRIMRLQPACCAACHRTATHNQDAPEHKGWVDKVLASRDAAAPREGDDG